MALISFVFANLFGCLALGGLELYSAWRDAPRRERAVWAAACALGFSIALLSTRAVVVRAGWPNESGFQLHALDLLDLNPHSTLKLGADAGKELSPLALKGVVEAFAGRSLTGWLAAQKVLWLLSALLVAGTLRRAGAGAAVALFGGALFLFNYLAILNSYALATTNTNVFYFLSAVCALARFRAAPDGPQSHRALSWFFCAAFLTFCARFEFVPALAWGLTLAWLERRARRLPSWLWWQAGTAAFSAAVWGVTLLDDKLAHFEVANPWKLISNLDFQLGRMNLTALTGMPETWAFPLAAAALGLLAWRLRERFWPLFLGGWILYFSIIFSPTSVHLLYNSRHHLYFFLPFSLLFPLLADAALSRLPRDGAGRKKAAAAALAAAAYVALNLRTTTALQADVRTNDREWQFLIDMQRSWPPECRVVSALWEERHGLLARLFPSAPAEGVAETGCYLIYRSPYDQIFETAGEDPSLKDARRRRDAVLYASPASERRFSHRYYTNYGRSLKTQSSRLSETWDTVPVTIGFYRLPDAVRGALALDAALLRNTHGAYDNAGRRAAEDALARARAMPVRPTDAAALAAWDPRGRARFLSDRGVLCALLGRAPEAAADLRLALKASPSFPPAALTLGGLYVSAGRRADALRLYAAALRAPAQPGDEVLRAVIAAESAKLSGQ